MRGSTNLNDELTVNRLLNRIQGKVIEKNTIMGADSRPVAIISWLWSCRDDRGD